MNFPKRKHIKTPFRVIFKRENSDCLLTFFYPGYFLTRKIYWRKNLIAHLLRASSGCYWYDTPVLDQPEVYDFSPNEIYFYNRSAKKKICRDQLIFSARHNEILEIIKIQFKAAYRMRNFDRLIIEINRNDTDSFGGKTAFLLSSSIAYFSKSWLLGDKISQMTLWAEKKSENPGEFHFRREFVIRGWF